MEVTKTGIPDLDLVLGGGLPSGSLVMLAGSPGTGKTILAQHICFSVATEQRRAVYYTSLSEPHAKLVRHLEQFAFFDLSALGTRVDFVHLGDLTSESDGAVGRIVAEVVREAFATRPAIVVIDSAKTLGGFGDPDRLRAALFELASLVASTGAVLILVGEYTPEEIEGRPEFAIADVTLHVAFEARDPADRRWLRTVKLRGGRSLEGKHALRISLDGIEVFPRLETMETTATPRPTRARISSGLAGLDALMGGGLHAADTTALLGPTGCGKTSLALRFIAAGVLAGERCLYVSFQETAPQLLAKAAAFGWDLSAAFDSGLLRICHIPPAEVNLDVLGSVVRRDLGAGPTQRVVVDSLTEIVLAAGEMQRLPAYCRALTAMVSAAGASLLITSETLALGPTLEPLGGLSFLFQNVVMLRYVEIGSELRRALSILKMRDSDHAKVLVQFDIDDHGPVIMEPLRGVSGALGWSALAADSPAH